MKSSLNIVFNPFLDVVLDETEQFTEQSWLFQFRFKMDYLDRVALSSINDYFKSFLKINLMSQIYVWAKARKENSLFEIYRIFFGMNLTVSELCHFEAKNDNKTLIKNGNQIWARRNNLTGVHLKVAYRPSVGYLHEKNNVI